MKIKRLSLMMGRAKKLEISIRSTTKDREEIEYNSRLKGLVSNYNKTRVLKVPDKHLIEVTKELEQHIKSGEKFGITICKVENNECLGKTGEIGGTLIVGRRQVKVVGKKPGGGPGPGPSCLPVEIK